MSELDKAKEASARAEAELWQADADLAALRLKHSLTNGGRDEIRTAARLRDIRRRRSAKRQEQLARAAAKARLAEWGAEREPFPCPVLKAKREALRDSFDVLAADDALSFLASTQSNGFDDIDYRRAPETCQAFRACREALAEYVELTGRRPAGNWDPRQAMDGRHFPDVAELERWARERHPQPAPVAVSELFAAVPPMRMDPPVPLDLDDEGDDLDDDDPDTDLVAVAELSPEQQE